MDFAEFKQLEFAHQTTVKHQWIVSVNPFCNSEYQHLVNNPYINEQGGYR